MVKNNKYNSVLLTSMRSPYLDDDKVYPPLGLLYLKSFLNNYGVDVTIDDDFDFLHPEKYNKYDLFGASVMTPQRAASLEFLNFCKSFFNADTVIGGPHALHYRIDVEKEKWDYIVCGDGFKSLLKIIQGSANRVEVNPLTKTEWRNLPRPDRSSDAAVKMLLGYSYTLDNVKATTMLTATGCPERCFVKNTRVVTSNSSNKKIQDIKVGDKLLAFDKGKVVETEVKKLVRNKADVLLKIKFKNGMIITCTEEHPFFVHNKWVLAKDLRVSDEITTIDFNDKISFYAKNNNCTKDEKVRQKISNTVKNIHKDPDYVNPFTLVPIEKKHNKYLRPDKWERQKKEQSKRMKKNNPAKDPLIRQKITNTYMKRMREGKIIPFMRTKEYWDKLKVTPNKSELIIDDILKNNFPKEYKFVGDGTVRLHYYSPDFINVNGKKKIIEFFGCYWHGCKKCNGKEISKRDVDRINKFKELGFETLVIYQHELKDKEQVIEKIGNFTYNGLKIAGIRRIKYKKEVNVHNFECYPYNNYFVYGHKNHNKYILSHNCKFCEDSQTAVRWSSIENIKEELNDIVNLGYGGVYIFDDLFAIALKMIRPICDEMQKRGLIYRCNGQARYFNEEFAKLLSATGCREIAFGAESGSQMILDNIDKRTTVEQNYKFVELCKKYNIICKTFLMIGLPGETYETIALTEKFIKEAQLDDFQLSIYYPYKGTTIRDEIDAKGESAGIFFEGEGLGAYGQKGGNTEAVVRTDALTSEELLKERDRLVTTYKPVSHKQKWTFFDEHLVRGGSI